MIADIEELEKMDASELHARRLYEKEVLTPMKDDNSILPVADGTPQIFVVKNEKRNKKFFEESQTDSFLQTFFKMTQHVMMRKLKMTSGLLREISFIGITWNPESNCTCRKKNNFLSR